MAKPLSFVFIATDVALKMSVGFHKKEKKKKEKETTCDNFGNNLAK